MFNKIMLNQIAKQATKLTTLITLGAFITLHSLSSAAATLAQEKKALADIKVNISSLETDIIELDARINNTKEQVKKHYITIAPLRKKLDKADATLIAARASSTASPTDSNKAKTSNAEFKFVLAERKYKKAEAKLEKAETNLDKLEKRKAEKTKQLQNQRQSLAVQKRKVKEWKPKPKRQTIAKARRPQPTRALPIAKTIPIAKTAPIAKTVPVTKAPAKPTTPTQRFSLDKEPNEVLKLAESTVKATPPIANTQSAAVAVTATASAAVKAVKEKGPQEPEAQQERRADQAERHKERLEELIESTSKRKKSAFPNETMAVEITEPNGKKHKLNIKLEHIQGQRYSAQARVFTGEMILKAAKTTWTAKIPAWDNNKTYQFIYDGRKGIGPVMIWYRTDLAR